MVAQHILTFSDVSKSFLRDNYHVQVLKNAYMYINQGEIVGLAGKSGAGKSTIINLIARLDQADRGEICLNGNPYNQKSSFMLNPNDVQVVFQDSRSSFDPRKTIGYSVAESLIIQGIARDAALKRASCILKECGLEQEFMHVYPHELSGGQCQRAAIAQTLALSPALICLDECTSALDPLSSIKIISLLFELRKKYGRSFLFASHDIDLLHYSCDRIYHLDQGILSLIEDKNDLVATKI